MRRNEKKRMLYLKKKILIGYPPESYGEAVDRAVEGNDGRSVVLTNWRKFILKKDKLIMSPAVSSNILSRYLPRPAMGADAPTTTPPLGDFVPKRY